MTTIGEAIAALGIEPHDGEDWCVVRIVNQRPVNRLLVDVAHADVGQPDLYLASGAFAPGTIQPYEGRSRGNLRRVCALTFDCDLADWIPDDDVTSESLTTWPQDEIDACLPAYVADVTDAFKAIGLPMHQLTYTGHGLLVLVRLAGGNDVDAIREAHKAIIATINKRAGYRLVDPAASDSGTRIFRLPGSVNAKGVQRQVRTLDSVDGALTLRDLLGIAGKAAPASMSQMLPMHARKLAPERAQAIVDALKPYWHRGVRHPMALGVAGYLMKSGVPEEQAQAMMLGLIDGDEQPRDRMKAVSTTYERARTGTATSGYHVLRDLLPAGVLDFVDRELSTLRLPDNPRIILHGTDSTPVAQAEPLGRLNPFSVDLLPESVWHGWFADYRELVSPLTVSPDQFHLAASLTMASAMMGRRVRTKFGPDMYANIFTVLLGPSGSSKKDTAIQWALSLPQIVGPSGQMRVPGYALSRDVSSSEGIVQMLKAEPNTLLYLTELSTLLSNARRKGTATILDKLIEAWDSPTVLENLNKASPNRAENPYLNVIAATQPARFAQQITDEDIASGFLNRWLFVPGVGKGLLDVPGEMDAALGHELYEQLAATLLAYPPGTVLRLTDPAKALIGAFYGHVQASAQHDEDESTMRQRHQTIAVKIALVYAAASGSQAIDSEHVQPAIDLVEWSWQNVKRYMSEWAVGRDVVIENRIMTALKKHGPVTRRQLQRICWSRKWSGADFAKTLDAMLKNETVVFTPLTGAIALPDD